MNNPVLFVVGSGWPTGLVGLIAGKIKEKYYKPTLVMSDGEKEITNTSPAPKDVRSTSG